MPTPEEIADALQGKRRYATDDPLAGYRAPTEGQAPFAYMPPQPTPLGIAQALQHQQRWGENRPMADQLADIAAKTGTFAKAAATAPINLVNKAYNATQQADEAARNPSTSSDDVYADPNAAAKDPAVPEAAVGMMGAGVLLAKPGALGMAGGKLVVPAAEKAAGTAGPFYSATEQAIANAKLQKAPLDQWHNYLKGQPGVKAEELAQLGITPENAASMPGALTKEQMQEHTLANQVQLKEVNKGAVNGKTRGEYLEDMRAKYGDNFLNQATQEERDAYSAAPPVSSVPKFSDSRYQLPGGANYGETLLTLPTKSEPPFGVRTNSNGTYSTYDTTGRYGSSGGTYGTREEAAADAAKRNSEGRFSDPKKDYISPHWPDDPNTIVHIRHNDRRVPGPNGEPLNALHLEEVQSDWAQQGRKQGFKSDVANLQKEYQDALTQANQHPPHSPEYEAGYRQASQIASKLSDANAHAVPDMPFKDTDAWTGLALKRMLHKAATDTNPDGTPKYHAMSWTPGEAQAARYDLSKHMDRLQYSPSDAGGRVMGIKNGQVVVNKDGVTPEKLADHIGKDAAEKLLGTEPSATPFGAQKGADGRVRNPNWTANLNGVHEIQGDDLKVGGSGMRAFYDKMLVDKANALGKKYGARVGQVDAAIPEHDRLTDPDMMDLEAEDPEQEAMLAAHTENVKAHKQPVHMLPITPELRAAAAKGFPLFALGAAAAGPALQAARAPQPLGDAAAKALATPPPRLPQ